MEFDISQFLGGGFVFTAVLAVVCRKSPKLRAILFGKNA